jgi:probable HAF family extracellular repeat protein
VTDALTGNPVGGASVEYAGPLNGTVTTGADGKYTITRVFGRTATLTLVAKKRGVYFDSDPQMVTVPPNAILNFKLGLSDIALSPSSFSKQTQQGNVIQKTLTIQNKGGAILSWSIYNELSTTLGVLSAGDVKRSFATPTDVNYPYGIVQVGNSLYVSNYTNKLFRLDLMDGHLLGTLTCASITGAWGLCYDGINIWVADYAAKKIAAVDVNSGNSIKTFDSPSGIYPTNVCYGNGTLWVMAYYTGTSGGTIYKMNLSDGSVIGTIPAPKVASGTVYNCGFFNGSIWLSSYAGDGKVYKVNPADGGIISSFQGPDNYVLGIDSDGDSSLWLTGYSNKKIYLVDSGDVVWITESPRSGTTPGLRSSNVAVTLDSNKCGLGTFKANICVASNDPDSPISKVPVTFTVTKGANRPPIAKDQSITTTVNKSAPIMLVATDPDNDPLTYSLVTNPSHGTLSGTTPNVTYTPVNIYVGNDSFTFKANDGTADSNVATVSITVSLQAPYDTTDDLTGIITAQGENGAAEGKAMAFDNSSSTKWLDFANANPSTRASWIQYQYASGAKYVVTKLTVTSANDAPERDPRDWNFLGSNDGGQTWVTLDTRTGETFGSRFQRKEYSFSNAAGYNIYRLQILCVSVPSSANAVQLAELEFIGLPEGSANHPPVAQNQSVTTDEDTAVSIVLVATDADNDPLTYSLVTQPARGTLSGSAPNVSYRPAANYNGADSFTFKANDGKADSNIATVSITVRAVNDPPVAQNQSVTTDEDAAVSIVLVATDVDNDPLTYSLVTQPAHGTLSGSAPNVSYRPAANYNGADSFTFKANDGKADSNIATVSITVRAVNDPPTANAGPDQTVTDADNNGVETVTLDGSSSSDPDGTIVNYVWTEGGTQIATGVKPAVALAIGTHTLTLTVTDDQGATGSDTVVITVQAGGAEVDHTDPPGSGIITARAEIHAGESKEKAFDNLYAPGQQNVNWSKWLDNAGVPTAAAPSWIQFEFGGGKSHVVNKYTIVSANDDYGRDPKDWRLLGWDGSAWTTLDARTGEQFGGRLERRVFAFSNSKAYRACRLEITANDGGVSMTQLAEIELIGPPDGGANQPPIANAGPDQTVTDADNNGIETVTLDGSASTDPDGTIQSYVWKEGATQLATGMKPSVTLAVGAHPITLTVTDNQGATASDTVVVTVNAGSDTDTTDDLKGTISARGENGSGEGMAKAFDNQAGTKWLDFSPQGSWIQYAYAAGISGRLSSYTITSANDAPERDPMDWQLLGSNDGGTTWTAADSRTGETFGARFQKRSFSLSGAPTYKAYRLNITKVQNPSSANSVQLAEIELIGQQVSGGSNQPPVASFTANPTSGKAPLAVAFDASASSDPDGTIVSYAWAFGDGQAGSGKTISHAYASAGAFTATLTVTDNGGLTATAAKTITVTAGSSILFADSFNDNSIGIAWSFKGGQWVEANQVMSQTSGADGDPKKSIVSNSGVDFGTNHTIVAKVRVDTWVDGDRARAGVSLFSNTSDGCGYNLVFHNNHSTVQFLDDFVTWGPSYTFNWTNGTWYWFKLRMDTGTLYGKVWQDGAAEPSAWPYQWARSGRAGYPALNGGSSAGGAYATVSFDDLSVTDNNGLAISRLALNAGPDGAVKDGEAGGIEERLGLANGLPTAYRLVDLGPVQEPVALDGVSQPGVTVLSVNKALPMAVGYGTWSTALGTWSEAGETTRGFLWTPIRGKQALPALGGTDGYAFGLSATGTCVSGSAETEAGENHAFVYLVAENKIVDLGAGGGSSSVAMGVNEKGDACGSVVKTDAATGQSWEKPVTWVCGGMKMELGTLAGEEGLALGINGRGDVVGWSLNGENRSVAVRWTTAGQPVDLNALMIPAGSGWVLETANGIDEQGNITGVGLIHGEKKQFQLVPLK